MKTKKNMTEQKWIEKIIEMEKRVKVEMLTKIEEKLK